ncbi:DUF2975 domain-containing protein [Psychroserpens sp.]|uniref:DUF2975 domain-containing protein n=1 Tax=Psychroserpens sp. TaxID=2020870 RepID=UPI001B14F3AF|nr:DUF2975 domain-containing protein [Psychroserpens sp.]MBO6605546.1 DUF2975 domain-containing protein [Psychroserpens sp.]MBO6630865.1 DUF2975 domain-containing protein [Psychroserpens sp.]MBO6653645.1 DUF2975 domain-containing protein [Psychroserpens sp.]MBO6681966.1 DUF2975 domain-containing protein [Psychroserpens sp.]MBO6748920.1 DUF2975 domain-containing protein [Psychroserpens sp.]
MKKLIVLKSLVDYTWIISCIPLLVALPVIVVWMFFDTKLIEKLNLVSSESTSTELVYAMFYVILLSVLVYIGIYCFYLFRKTLRYFQRSKPFHHDVIQNFNKIGKLLNVIGIVGCLGIFLGQFILTDSVSITFGFSPYVMIICLGLFFMVLSELFKGAKVAKEENELTI